jgi:hypothetical protein
MHNIDRSTISVRSLGVTALMLGSLAAISLSACGGASKSNGATGSTGSSSTTSAKAVAAVESRFAPANFVQPGRAANRYLPLKPGLQWVRLGSTLVGHRPVPHRVISTVSGVTKIIDGVRTIGVLDQDIDAGQLAQYSVDWWAEDHQGAVWSMGTYTENYEGGRYVSVFDAWLAGVNGGEAGKLMLGDPRVGTPYYSIARPPGEEGDVAQVVKENQRTCVRVRCFNGVVVIREGKSTAPDNEFKYYAPGVGQVLNTPRSASKHKDFEQLINVTRLSPQGLAEVNTEVLHLDRHARVVKPGLYGKTERAQRTL